MINSNQILTFKINNPYVWTIWIRMDDLRKDKWTIWIRMDDLDTNGRFEIEYLVFYV